MAKDKETKKNDKDDTAQTDESLKTQGSEDQGKKKKEILFGLVAFLTALVIMAGVMGGAFFVAVHNNINGLGERYRKDLQGIPVLKWALPTVPDPEDPKYLTDTEIKKKYEELRQTKTDLTKKLEDANKKIQELQKYKDNESKLKAENEKVKSDMNTLKAQTDAQKKGLDDEKKQIEQMIATGDKAGFKAYFEQVSPDVAKQVYEQIMKEQKASDDAIKFAKIYESMDSSAAATVLEKLGTAKLDLVVDILKNMKKESTAAILAAMTPSYASKVTEALSKVYMSNQNQNASTQKTQ